MSVFWIHLQTSVGQHFSFFGGMYVRELLFQQCHAENNLITDIPCSKAQLVFPFKVCFAHSYILAWSHI